MRVSAAEILDKIEECRKTAINPEADPEYDGKRLARVVGHYRTMIQATKDHPPMAYQGWNLGKRVTRHGLNVDSNGFFVLDGRGRCWDVVHVATGLIGGRAESLEDGVLIVRTALKCFSQEALKSDDGHVVSAGIDRRFITWIKTLDAAGRKEKPVGKCEPYPLPDPESNKKGKA